MSINLIYFEQILDPVFLGSRLCFGRKDIRKCINFK